MWNGRLEMNLIIVKAEWDEEAGVYVATSEDVPGLVTEASGPRELHKKLRIMIPDLLELNGMLPDDGLEIPLHVVSSHMEKIRLSH